jgi:hypothetical protein
MKRRDANQLAPAAMASAQLAAAGAVSKRSATDEPTSLGGVLNLDDACTLLTNADVHEVLNSLIIDREPRRKGVAAEYVHAASGRVTAPPPEKTCFVGSSSGDVIHPEAMKVVAFSITVGTVADYQREQARAGSRGTEPLPGVAEQAFWNGGNETAVALKGGRAVVISGIGDRSAAVALLKRAAARLP